MVEQSYIDGCIELAKFKTKYNVKIKDTINFFKDIADPNFFRKCPQSSEKHVLRLQEE